MRGQLIGQPAHFAAAHGVGLAGDGKRRCAGLADAAGGQMAVDNGVALVGAGGALVDALGVERHRARAAGEPAEEGLNIFLGQITALRQVRQRTAIRFGPGQGVIKAAGVFANIVPVQMAVPVQPGQQTVEQQAIGAGP